MTSTAANDNNDNPCWVTIIHFAQNFILAVLSHQYWPHMALCGGVVAYNWTPSTCAWLHGHNLMIPQAVI